MSAGLLLGAAAAGALLFLLGLYLVHLRTGDAGIVDFGWSAGLGAAALFYACFGDGGAAHRLALAAVAGAWSLRLALYILRDRVLRGGEDPRYAMLRAAWGPAARRRFLGVFVIQGALVAVLSIPFLAVAQHPGPGLGALGALGVALGLGAIAGESVADRQLQRWRSRPEHRGKTCRSGLWRYSRHPNYFFEWLHWWAYVLLAAPGWWRAAALLGPALMFVFLHRVTGIPHAERQALRSRGDDYRAYQRETSAFVPWFPRKTAP